MIRWAALAVICTLAALGCRDDAGIPDYSDLEEVFEGQGQDAGTAEDNLGPDPFVLGETRLSLGIFYEGEASETLVIDGVRTNFFIFEETFTVEVDRSDPVEGDQADRIIISAAAESEGFWGGGVFVENPPLDLTDYDVLAVSLRSNDIELVEIRLGNDGVAVVALDASNYGFEADGTWYNLRIPLSDFTGVDLSAVDFAFGIGGTDTTAGRSVLVDDLYFEAE